MSHLAASTIADSDPRPLTITLGKNKMVFDHGWKVTSSDLDVATQQIGSLLDSKAKLEATVASLRTEVSESNKMKTVALDMVSAQQ